jgi:membrane protease YdiL (CAAX protease family)
MMKTGGRKQLLAMGIAVGILALIACVSYLVIPLDQFALPGQALPASVAAMPRWQLAAGNAVFVLVPYGLLALAGYWFAQRLQLPPMYREGAGWRVWVVWPMLFGLGIGVVLVIGDQVLARLGSTQGFPHPAFPLSVFASGAGGIGEEVLFRGFVMGLWVVLLNLVLKRSNGRTAALWIGNVIAALAFSASHVPGTMLLLNVTSVGQIPVSTLAELLLLNSFLGLVAGWKYMRDGLVTAMGIHFWADILWHVIWPLLGIGV